MNCAPGTDDFSIPGFRRRQFPIRVSFAMTINKAQGQTVTGKLGIDLINPFFPMVSCMLHFPELHIRKMCTYVQHKETRRQKMWSIKNF